jgi:hypothetical protein
MINNYLAAFTSVYKNTALPSPPSSSGLSVKTITTKENDDIL